MMPKAVSYTHLDVYKRQPVYNPFPYDGDQVFTAKVRQAVQMANEVAPNEYLPFSPWRAGKIALSELELMDTFGRYWPPDRVAELEDFTIQVTDTMPELAESAGQEMCIRDRCTPGHWRLTRPPNPG